MISFLQPLALLGLLAAAIPPLLHLIERRTPPTVPFPAVHYLAETTREQHRRLKLRNLLLLLLRTGLVALLALAAARPVVPWSVGSAHAPTAVAIVLDNSLSSGAVVDGRPVIDALRDHVREVLRALAPADHVWLVLADGTPRRLSAEEALRAVSDVRVNAARLDLSAAVRTAAGLVRADPLPNRVVLCLSDLQASSLSAGEAPGVAVVAWGPAEALVNHAIDSAWTDPPLFRPTGTIAAATSGGDTPLALRFELDGREAARALVRPGEVAVLQPAARRPGWAIGRVLLDADELRADDEWWVALHTVQPAAVRAGPGAGRFVADALGVLAQAGRVRAGDEVTIDAAAAGRGTAIVLPPADPAMLGAVNRALAARGVSWRYGTLVRGEWQASGPALPHFTVRQRYVLQHVGEHRSAVLARISNGADAWMVRDGPTILIASRMDPDWTALPLEAGFIPALDQLVNRLAAGDAGVVATTPGALVTLPEGVTAVLLPDGAESVAADHKLAAPLETGAYFLRGAGADTVGVLLVNHDSRESALARATPAALHAALGVALTLPPANDVTRSVFQGERRADLAGLLLGCALVVAVVELGLASAGGRRA